MNYFGHGGWSGLASEGMLNTSDFSALTNRTTPSILTAMTCLINRFEMPGAEGFSERLLLEAPGGVAGVWSATGLSYNNLAEVLDRAFYVSRYQNGISTLGEAVRQALKSGQAQGVQRFELDIITLLGDPALRLR
ncbi:MAG: C25 family cysteine peptidase [Kiritimatiellaeota bacterium]|nr:C25 family cysteine peptidase [Kiritimatiellota bacterium]